MKRRIVLASGSPRRRELLQMIGAEFDVITSDCDEIVTENLSPASLVGELALRKAKSVLSRLDGNPIVIGADTVVSINGKILGKPKNRDEAIDMLMELSGREHSVFSGLALLDSSKTIVDVSETRVKFINLTPAQCEKYVETGEPLDKAGSYGIQGRGGIFVEKIEGDYFNVVGLPISRLCRLLSEQFNVNIL
jgi:septum formation protein